MYEDEKGSITPKDIISLSNKADRAFLEMHNKLYNRVYRNRRRYRPIIYTVQKGKINKNV